MPILISWYWSFGMKGEEELELESSNLIGYLKYFIVDKKVVKHREFSKNYFNFQIKL